MSLNRCEFIGNLGADPETRRLSSGDPVVNLRIAVTEKWRGSDGEKKERTEWVPVTIYNDKLAKVAEQYLKKGSKVFIAGAWQTRKWTDAQGVEKYMTECALQKFRGELSMLDGPQSNENKPQRQERTQSYGDQSGGGYGGGRDLDDEVPFAPEWRV